MRSRTAAWIIAAAMPIACGGSQHSSLSKAGDERDEGAGQLAQASMRLSTEAGEAELEEPVAPRTLRRYELDYGGAMYGGAGYGGAAYGGTSYGSWTVPQWSYAPPLRVPRYQVMGNLRSAIEGTVTWQGAAPGKIATACGPIDNPTLRVGTDKGAPGVVVFIEKVAVGRAVPYYTRPATVGGVVAKRGCALIPSVQIVSPLPGAIAIHGDEQRAKLRIAPDKAAPASHELQEGGLVQVEVKQGVPRVEAEDGKLSPAWVLGLETPYFAITDDAGRYRIDELAPGTYEVTFWHAPVASVKADGVFAFGPPIAVKKTVHVTGRSSQLSVSIGR
jgi:hypothetical protein